MDCVFCAIAAGVIKSDVVYSDDLVVAFRDINPVAPVHVLVVPRKHVVSALELDPADDDLLGAIQRAIQAVAHSEGIARSGFRVVTNVGEGAGQSVGHLHYHVLGGRAFAWPPG